MWLVVLICIGIVFENVKFGNARDFAVRLTSIYGSDAAEGRLEIFYNGSWGTVCADYFTNASATVACASLGFGSGKSHKVSVIRNRRRYYAYDYDYDYDYGTGPIWLSEVNCTGTESGIEQCAHNGWGSNNCSHNNDVSIRCDCGIRHFSGPTGQISSPNFPEQYANGLECHNYIAVLSRETIIMTFLVLNTEDGYDWVKIICESGNTSRSTSFSGSQLPPVLTLSSCNLLNVHFHSSYYDTKTGFSLKYNVTTDNVIGGFTTKPTNAFPRTDKRDTAIFNCTTTSSYLPWWTINDKRTINHALTDSACRVIGPHPITSWFQTETLGPGSCNLIVCAPADILFLLAGIVTCIDSTLSSAGAILAPINLELRVATGINFSARAMDVVRDEEISISCNASFFLIDSRSSLEFIDFQYVGGPDIVLVRIMKIYLTSERNDISNTSSYVLVKARKDGVFPPYMCNIVCDFYTNISDLSGDSPMELSFSTDPLQVLYWPTEDNMRITGDNNGWIRAHVPLNCYAAVYPPATYAWTDESSGDIINDSSIAITHGGKYTCNASNTIRGKRYQQSKSITLQIVEDKTVLVMLGVSVLTIIIIVVIIVIRLCRQQKRTTDNGKDYELPQRGGEGNIYEAGLGTDPHVSESDYDQPDDPQRRLPAIPSTYMYDKIEDRDHGYQFPQSAESNLHEAGLGRVIYIKESEYDVIDDSLQRLSGMYDELEVDK